jgi:hypothetical protein
LISIEVKMSKIRILKGGCHCKNIQFEFKTQVEFPNLSVRRCDCSYCTKSGTRYVSDPAGDLVVNIESREQLQPYQFGTKSAKFLVCKTCGIVALALCEIDGHTYGIVNVNALDEADHFSRHASVMSYEGESLEDRLARRKKNWIGTVHISGF